MVHDCWSQTARKNIQRSLGRFPSPDMRAYLRIGSLLLSAIIIFQFYTADREGRQYYNTLFNKIVCHNLEGCIHETAHFIDDAHGWISKKEFKEAILRDFGGVNFPGINLPMEKTCHISNIGICFTGWGGWDEFYATMFEYYGGCENRMMDGYAQYFDFELANAKLKELGFVLNCDE